MKFGLQLSPYVPGPTGNPWDRVVEVARVVDESTFHSLWLYDHFLYEGGYPGHPLSEPVLECFTTLAAVAAITRRVRIGQLVAGVPYRNPALVAKMATSLDLISHGRSILGLGAGWHKREYEGYGWGTFEPVSVRMDRLEEAIGVVLALWRDRLSHFDGQYYHLDHVLENPTPLQLPHPPILIGGNGTRRTLSIVARYAQFCNVTGSPATVANLFQVLYEHCQRLGRKYEDITRSIYVTVIVGHDDADLAAKSERLRPFIPSNSNNVLIGLPDALIEKLREYQQAGCQYTILRMPDWSDIEPVQLFIDRVISAMPPQ